jgi:molybdenum cofactor biosynthesis enzyme
MDRGMRISDVELMHKSGGKSGDYDHPEAGALNAQP